MLSDYESDILTLRYIDEHGYCIYMAGKANHPRERAWWQNEAAWYRTQIVRIKAQQERRRNRM